MIESAINQYGVDQGYLEGESDNELEFTKKAIRRQALVDGMILEIVNELRPENNKIFIPHNPQRIAAIRQEISNYIWDSIFQTQTNADEDKFEMDFYPFYDVVESSDVRNNK